MSWWRRLRNRDRIEDQLDAELRDHVERQVADHVRAGVPEHEARRRARLDFGGLDQVKELCRDARRLRWLEDAWRDVRFAARLLARNRSFTIVTVSVLALGIGVTTQFFVMFYAITLRSLPIDDPERVVHISTRDARARRGGVSYADFEDIRDAARSIDALAAYRAGPVAVGDDDLAPVRLERAFISASGLSLLGETPILGRDFRDADDRPGARRVVILAAHAWRDRYGGEPGVVGRVIRIDGEPATVIGVMPDGFRFPRLAELWQPVSQMAGLEDQPRDARGFGVIGRLVDDAAVGQAAAEIDAITAALARDHPESHDQVRHVTVTVPERFVGSDASDPTWFAFLSAGLMVLLIACANAANLLLMQAARRGHEIAVRTALGASRWRVVRQLLIESTVLASLGVLVGSGLAMLGLQALDNAIPEGMLGYWITFDFDIPVFAAMSGIGGATVFLFGLIPALSVSRAGGRSLGHGARTGASRDTSRLTSVFLTAEFGLTLILLAGVSGSVLSFIEARRTFTAVDASSVLTAQVNLTTSRYETPEARAVFFEDVRNRLGSRGGATAAIVNALPGGGRGGTTERRVVVDQRPAAPADALPTVLTLATGPGYFDTLGVPLLRGRPFSARDGAPESSAAIVNARFVEIHFADEEPLGRRIRLVTETQEAGDPQAAWLTIVGVAPTLRQRLGRGSPDPLVYLPYRADPPRTATLVVRSPGDPTAAASRVRDTVRQIDPDLPLFRVATLEQALHRASWNGRTAQATLWTIALIALILSTAGLYAVTSHAVQQRLREIAIRMTLGAQPVQVSRMVLWRATRHLALGTIAGVAGIAVWSTWIAGWDTGGRSGWISQFVLLAPGALVVALVGLTTTLASVRRAARLDPMTVLRQE
ncbi:MAG: ADOP family duplicated permease [Acidobacteria bacterium]|nr:ADOP family duplicated permease [Acidobacteriota bacterium]